MPLKCTFQTSLGSSHASMRRCLHPSNCSQQGLWIILRHQSMSFGMRQCCWVFQLNFLWHFEHRKPSSIWFHYIWDKADISMAPVDKVRQFTQNNHCGWTALQVRGKIHIFSLLEVPWNMTCTKVGRVKYFILQHSLLSGKCFYLSIHHCMLSWRPFLNHEIQPHKVCPYTFCRIVNILYSHSP